MTKEELWWAGRTEVNQAACWEHFPFPFSQQQTCISGDDQEGGKDLPQGGTEATCWAAGSGGEMASCRGCYKEFLGSSFIVKVPGHGDLFRAGFCIFCLVWFLLQKWCKSYQ